MIKRTCLTLLLIFVLWVPPIARAGTQSPDLTIKSITFDAQGRPTVVFENIGQLEAHAGRRFTARSHTNTSDSGVVLQYVKSDFHPIPSYSIHGMTQPESTGLPRPLNPNTTFSFSMTNPPPAQATHIRIEIDDQDTILESDETNNLQYQLLSGVTPPATTYPDLTISGITFDQATGLPIVSLTNLGPAEAYANDTTRTGHFGGIRPYVLMSYAITDFAPNSGYGEMRQTLEYIDITKPLPAGATQTIRVTKPIPPNATHYSATADYQEGIVETNEGNNSLRVMLPGITPPGTLYPDLVIQSIALDPSSGRPVITYKNDGPGDVFVNYANDIPNSRAPHISPQGFIEFLVSDFQNSPSYSYIAGEGHAEDFGMPKHFAPGETGTYTGTQPVPRLATHVRVTIDKEISVVETNESNNEMLFELPSGDLVIESLTQNPAGGAKATLKNVGNQSVRLNGKNVQYSYTAGDQTLYQNYFVGQNLEPAGTISFDVPIPATDAGATMVIDPNNNIPESNDGNNSISVKFFLKTKTTADVIKEVNLGLTNQLKLASPAATMPIVSAATNIKALPCEPLYAVKSLGRSVKKSLTFGSENKAKLDMAIANEKVIEGATLASQNKPDCAAKALESAAKDSASANSQIEKLSKTASASAQTLATTAVGNQLLAQQVTGTVLQITPTADLATITASREKSLGTFAKSIELLDDSDKIKLALSSVKSATKEPLSVLGDLEVLTAVQDKVSSIKQTDIIALKDDAITQVRQTLQSLPTDQVKQFSEVVKAIGGEDSNKLKLLDEVRLSGVTDEVRLEVLGAKDDVTKDFQDTISQVAKDDPKATQVILKDLTDGSITDLRVLSDLSNSKDTLLDKSINEVKDESIKAFVGDSGQQELAKDYADATQIQVIQDIKEIVPQDEVIQKLDESLRDEVKINIDKEVTGADEYAEFIGKFAGDNPEDVKAVKDFAEDLGDKQLTSDLIKEQIMVLKDLYASADDATQADLSDEMFNDQDLTAIFEEYDPSYDEWQAEYNVDEEPINETVVDEPVDETSDEEQTIEEDIPVDDSLDPVMDNSQFTYDDSQPEEEPEATPEEEHSDEEEILGATTDVPQGQLIVISPVIQWLTTVRQWLVDRI